MDLNRRHDCCVKRNDHHLPEENPKRVGFVKVQDMPKPDFVVVFNHLKYVFRVRIELVQKALVLIVNAKFLNCRTKSRCGLRLLVN